MAVALALLSALMFGTSDFTGGYLGRTQRVAHVVFLSQIAGLLLALLLSPVVGVPWALFVRGPWWRDLAWGSAAGLSGVVGLLLLYDGLARGRVAIVAPLSALVGVLVPVLFGYAIGERASLLASMGMLVTVPAVLLLTVQPGAAGLDRMDSDREKRHTSAGFLEQDERAAVRHSVRAAVSSGVAFGLFFILIAQTDGDSGLWPLVAARTCSLTAVGLTLRRKGEVPQFGGKKRNLALIVAIGSLDMGANVLFVLASRMGLLMLVTLATGLYPAPTVLLARLIYGEKMQPQRVLGLVLALIGVALMGGG